MSRRERPRLGMQASTFISQTVVGSILIILCLVMILPVIYVVLVSFTDASVYEAATLNVWPRRWSIESYRLVTKGQGFINALKASLFITLVGTPLNVIFNAGLGYMLSRSTLPGRRIINRLVMFTMLFGAGMVPAYINISQLRLIDSWFAIILPASCGAWTVMVMKSFFQSLPEELNEAASIDGCGPLRTFFIISLPLSRAMLATFTLFAAVSYWNTYFSAVMYITRTTRQPLQVFLQKIVLGSNYSDVLDVSSELAKTIPTEVVKMTTVVIAILPIMMVYPFLQKNFAKGVMLGAVKG